MRTVAILVFVIGAASRSGPAQAANPDKPHPHQGSIEGYDEFPEIALTEKQFEKLDKGKTVIMSFPAGELGGRGIAILDIAAPPDTVWSRINGFEHHAEWVGPVKLCEVYRELGDTTYTHVKISGFLYGYEYFLVNRFRAEDGVLTWSLDYTRESDFDDNVGCWVVEAHPEKENWSRAWFSCDLALKTKLPGFLMNFARKKALKNSTKWVKRESEKAMDGE
jgi:hypothetical protein